ncbi:hypothetical protein TUM17577_14630 [Enterobacter asburiae]|nr:hypothetical protein TUM17577_14630 [Enterobacter asburiae]
MFKHLKMVQRCGGNKESIKRYGEKFRKRSAARDAFRLPGGENIKSKTMNRVTKKVTQRGQIRGIHDRTKTDKS